MRLLPLNRVPDGAELGRDVSTGRVDRIPLLRAGTRMNARYREALEREGVGAIYIRDEGTEGIEPQV